MAVSHKRITSIVLAATLFNASLAGLFASAASAEDIETKQYAIKNSVTDDFRADMLYRQQQKKAEKDQEKAQEKSSTPSDNTSEGSSSSGSDGVANTSSSNVSSNNASSSSAPQSGKIKSGSDFKTGPVTDDEKLLKPVAKDAKNPDQPNSSKLSPNIYPKGTDEDSQKSQNTGKERVQASPGSTQSDDQLRPKKNIDVTINEKGPISIGAVKVAKDLQMMDLMGELTELKKSGEYKPGRRVHNIEIISLRQDIDEILLSSFLSTRRVVSELDRQISGYDAVARVLEEKRDQSIRNNTILNFTSGGALAMTQGGISIGTAMKYQNVGNELGAVAGALTALIGVYALKIQKGAKRSSERDPNMLAPIFGLEPNEPNKYPSVVWNYLNEREPEQTKTRRQQLIDRWVKLNYIEPLNKPSSHQHLQELSGTIPLKKVVTIDLLRDRIPMLEDVRATVAGINEYLDEILTFIRKP